MNDDIKFIVTKYDNMSMFLKFSFFNQYLAIFSRFLQPSKMFFIQFDRCLKTTNFILITRS